MKGPKSIFAIKSYGCLIGSSIQISGEHWRFGSEKLQASFFKFRARVNLGDFKVFFRGPIGQVIDEELLQRPAERADAEHRGRVQLKKQAKHVFRVPQKVLR